MPRQDARIAVSPDGKIVVEEHMETNQWGGPVEALFRPLMARWYVVVAAMLIGVFGALLWQMVRTPAFTASSVVAATRDEAASLADRVGGLGGLAAMAGVSLPGGSTTEFDKFKFLVASERLAAYQVEKRQILPIVFHKDWDAKAKQWQRPTGLVQAIKDLLWPLFGLDPWLPPDAEALARFYSRNLVQRENKDSGLVELSLQADRGQVARQLLQYNISDANEILREDAAQRATKRAAYLRRQLQVADIVEHRQNIARMLSIEEQTLMLVSTSLPFAAEMVQPVAVTSQPTSQRPALFALIGALIGLSLGSFIALLMPVARSSAQTSAQSVEAGQEGPGQSA